MGQELFVAVCHNKGGVGKSTTVIHLADAYWQNGKKVIVVDGDRIGALRNWAKLRGAADSFPVMGVRQSFNYKEPKEIVIFDTAGGIEDEEISDLISFVNFFILPTNTDAWSVVSTVQMAKEFIRQNINFRVLINRSFGNNSRANELKEHFQAEGIPYFEQIIPRSALIEDAINSGRAVSQMSGARAISDKYSEIAEQTLTDINKHAGGKVKRAKDNK